MQVDFLARVVAHKLDRFEAIVCKAAKKVVSPRFDERYGAVVAGQEAGFRGAGG